MSIGLQIGYVVWALVTTTYLACYGYQMRKLGGLCLWLLVGIAWVAFTAILLTTVIWPPFNYLSVAAIVVWLAGLMWLLGRPQQERLRVVLIKADEFEGGWEENARANSGSGLRY